MLRELPSLYEQTANLVQDILNTAVLDQKIRDAGQIAVERAQIEGTLTAAYVRAEPIVRAGVRDSYVSGATSVSAKLGRRAHGDFTTLDANSLVTLQDDGVARLRALTDMVMQSSNDVLHQIALEHLVLAQKIGLKHDNAADVIERVFDRSGVTYDGTLADGRAARLVKGLKSNWQVDTYSRMLARTLDSRATNVAAENTCYNAGHDLVTVVHPPDGSDRDAQCTKYDGVVLSLSGAPGYPRYGSPEFPKVPDGTHPNCRGRLVPVLR